MTKKFVAILTFLLLLSVLSGCQVFKNKNANDEIKNIGAKMMYEKLTPNVMVEDVNSTVEYYRDVLGFEFVIGVPENTQEIAPELKEGQILDFAIMKHNNIEIMLQSRKSLSEEISEFGEMNMGGSVTIYINVDDVKKLYADLKNKVSIVVPLTTKFYGMEEFYIRDCNGYILGFGSKI